MGNLLGGEIFSFCPMNTALIDNSSFASKYEFDESKRIGSGKFSEVYRSIFYII